MNKLAHLGRQGFRVWRNEGTRGLVTRVHQRLARQGEADVPTFTAPFPYDVWIDQNEPKAGDLRRQWRTRFPYRPKISIVVPTYNTPVPFLVDMLRSVFCQTYTNWELCVADGGSTKEDVKATLAEFQAHERRIRLRFLPENLGIVGNSNAAHALATGDFLTFLDHDDMLAPWALFEIARAVNADPQADFFYSDEDMIDAAGAVRSNPHFKPDWAPDNLRSHNYITHLAIYRRDLFFKLGGFRSGFEGSQDYDLILRAGEHARRIVHIPSVLYHWRVHEESTSSGESVKTYAYEAARKALRAHLIRTGMEGEVKDAFTHGIYQVTYKLPSRPLVSVLIPNRDHADVLERCLRSVRRSTYTNYEIVLIENGSREPRTHELYGRLSQEPDTRIVPWDKQPFNYSAVTNFGAAQARGEVLLLLNNDIDAINPDWLERMLEHVLRPGVGAVGAKLYYPDDTLQHGGVIVGLGGVAAHSHTHFPRSSFGYQGRLIVIQNLSAVTAACLMVKKAVFEEVGGFDEAFAVAFNDVDFCLRLRQKNYVIVWTPFAELYHCESKTRGVDDTPEKKARFQGEIDLFKKKWAAFLSKGDPYYSPNLNYGTEDFSYRF
jgi:GT2 family glycosyltransferase